MGVILCHGLQGFSRSAEGPSTGAGPAGAASSKGGAIQARPRAHGLLRRAYLPRRQGDEGDLRSPHSGILGTGYWRKLEGRYHQGGGRSGAPLGGGTLPATDGGFSRLEHAYPGLAAGCPIHPRGSPVGDRKSTRLNSSHLVISYAVFCLKKKNMLSLVSFIPNITITPDE